MTWNRVVRLLLFWQNSSTLSLFTQLDKQMEWEAFKINLVSNNMCVSPLFHHVECRAHNPTMISANTKECPEWLCSPSCSFFWFVKKEKENKWATRCVKVCWQEVQTGKPSVCLLQQTLRTHTGSMAALASRIFWQTAMMASGDTLSYFLRCRYSKEKAIHSNQSAEIYFCEQRSW